MEEFENILPEDSTPQETAATEEPVNNGDAAAETAAQDTAPLAQPTTEADTAAQSKEEEEDILELDFSDVEGYEPTPAQEIPVQTPPVQVPPAYTPPVQTPPFQTPPVQPASPFANSPYVAYHDRVNQPVQPAHTRKARKKRPAGRTVLSIILVIALVVASCTVTASMLNTYWGERLSNTTAYFQRQMANLESRIGSMSGNSGGTVAPTEGMTPGQVYAQNISAVVAITCEVSYNYASGVSSGSGFIISEDGYVLTNAHVVENAVNIQVGTHDNNVYTAKLIGADSVSDVALLKIEGTGFGYVTLGSSASVVVGDQVAAIGNPLGTLSSTMTVGYISAKDRVVTTDGSAMNMLQTDAAINSGNSGGPLFNMRGEVIGITTAKYSGTSSSGVTIEGIGFAIPIDDVKDIMNDLMNNGYVSSAYLGITVEDVPEVAQNYGLPAGAFVREVVDGYCAKEAGIKPNDIIVKLGDYEITSTNDLLLALRKFQPGDQTVIVVSRGGMEVPLGIVLDEKPQS